MVTYYESYRQDGPELQVKLGVGYFGRDKQIEYPKRMLRKVLCRIYIPPIGVTSTKQEGIWGWSWFKDKAGKVLDWGSDVMGRIVVVALWSRLDIAQSIVGGAARVACSGMTYLDQGVRLEVGGDAEPIRPTATHGALRLSEVEANRNTGPSRCRSICEREDLACDFDGSVAFRQNCGSLPEVQPYIRSVDFVTPENPVSYAEYSLLSQEVVADAGVPIGPNGYSYGLDQGETRFVQRLDRGFRPSYAIGDGNVALQPNSKGLSRVEVAWKITHTGDNPVP